MVSTNNLDFTILLFLNRFVGKSRSLDELVHLFTEAFLFNGVLLVALLWLLWFTDRREEARIRLFIGGAAAVLAGLLSRLLQLSLPFHVRPLYNPALNLTWPIGVGPGTLNHWSSFPSDHASLCFALATLIWTRDRRLGVFAFFWASFTSFARVFLGFHYPSDILGGAVLGILIVILFGSLPLPRVAYRLLEWERFSSPSFYAVAFVASYQAGTLFSDLREIGHLIVGLL
jgi:membrane-associated phospholipid phosphatase